MAKRIVIVGGVAGGASAAARARRLSEEVDLRLIGIRPGYQGVWCWRGAKRLRVSWYCSV
jgi:6-phosphofructokinase